MAKRKLDYRREPKPVQIRVGIKVGWWYYLTREEAERASVVAQHNARIDESLGYDFGYCSPGSIRELTETWVDKGYGSDPTTYEKGWFEVCHS